MTMVIEERKVVAPLTAPRAAASPATAARAVAAMPNEFLSFRLGGEEYGIEILGVQEIRSYQARPPALPTHRTSSRVWSICAA